MNKLYKNHQTMPTLNKPSVTTSGPSRYRSLEAENITIVIRSGKREFETIEKLDKIFKYIEELEGEYDK